MKCNGREHARLCHETCIFSCTCTNNYLVTLNKSFHPKIEYCVRAMVSFSIGRGEGYRITKRLFKIPSPPSPTQVTC